MFLILFFIFFGCSLFYEPESETQIIEKYPLCLIDQTGQNYQTLSEDGYSGALFHFLTEDKIFIMWSNTIYHFNIKTSDLTFIKNLPQREIRYQVISPNGQSLAYVNFAKDNSDLYLVDLYGNNLQNLTNSPTTIKRWPAFSSDGSKIIFNTSSDYDDQTLSVYDLKSGSSSVILTHFDPHTTLNPEIYFWYPCYGENNDQIFYLKRNTSKTTIGDTLYHYNISTRTHNALATDLSFIGRLLISDMKNRLVYFKQGNPYSILAIDPNGDNMVILDDGVSSYCEYNISTDGEKIMYWDSYYYRNSRDIPLFIIDKDGMNKKKLASGSNAYFSPFNIQIVFVGYKRIESN